MSGEGILRADRGDRLRFASKLTACVICSAAPEEGLPIFYSFAIERAGIRMPLWPNVILDEWTAVCVCHSCAQTTSVESLVLAAAEREAA